MAEFSLYPKDLCLAKNSKFIGWGFSGLKELFFMYGGNSIENNITKKLPIQALEKVLDSIYELYIEILLNYARR